MKTIFYISIFFVASMNACQQNNQSKTTSVETTDNTAVEKIADTTENKTVTVTVADKDTQTKNENKISKSAEKGKEYFKLLNATSESWTAGVANGGSGIEYYFKIKITTSDNIKFDTAWINNKAFEIYISKETNSVSSQPIKYGNGETITLRVSDLKNQNSKSENANPPKKYDGAALIDYTVNGRREYFTIKEIKKQTSPNRP